MNDEKIQRSNLAALHIEAAVQAGSAAERLLDYGDTKKLADAYRALSEAHRQAEARTSKQVPATPELALQRCRAVLALHKEMAPVAEAFAQMLDGHDGTDELAKEHRALAHAHRKAAAHIEENILDEHGNLK